jgi:hypothetical protein
MDDFLKPAITRVVAGVPEGFLDDRQVVAVIKDLAPVPGRGLA